MEKYSPLYELTTNVGMALLFGEVGAVFLGVLYGLYNLIF